MSNVVILGAGLTGLSAAYHLNSHNNYIILESENRVGGLCRTETKNGFTFDYTGHFLHFKNPIIKKLIFDLMGDKLCSHTRKSGIFLKGVTTPYPFQLNTFGHSVELIKECLMGIIEAKYNSPIKDINNFEDWILKSCGEGVAKHFMIPYNAKIWTVHPSEMTTDWMGNYVPTPDIASALDGALRPPPETIGYNSEFFYPKDGGIESLPHSFLPHISNISYNTPVESIDIRQKKVWASGKEYSFKHLISSLPLNKLIHLIKDIDPSIVGLTSQLRHNSVYTVNIGINRPNISNYHWLYFPESDYCFYRAGFPSQLSPSMAPNNCSSVNVEISYSKDKPIDENTVLDRVISDLKKAHILLPEDKILTTLVLKIPCAYVIYDKNRNSTHETLQTYLRSHNIYSAGRYGNWEYSAMEDALNQGIQWAQHIAQVSSSKH